LEKVTKQLKGNREERMKFFETLTTLELLAFRVFLSVQFVKGLVALLKLH